jgi:hypothetical protein
MQLQLIKANDDLKRLQDEGYHIEIKEGHLLMRDVPYVNSRAEIQRGTLISPLDLTNDKTIRPNSHVVYFSGEYPCNQDGTELSKIKHQSAKMSLGNGIEVDHSFSSKPPSGYTDFYDKMSTYAKILSQQAQLINPSVTAQTFPMIATEEDESVFQYVDTASSRAKIGGLSHKLQHKNVAIVGVGGTGSYILDFLAKTPIFNIHIFDGDVFYQHNAFRSPGAASRDDLEKRLAKVDYYKDCYENIRKYIIPHAYFLGRENADDLRGMDFVFLCVDNGESKQALVEAMESYGIPFIDVGMGIYSVDEQLSGSIRVTSSQDSQRDHFRQHVSFADNPRNDEYSTNIQIVELNALNAALAVIKWKKMCGFYQDLKNEFHSTYGIDTNKLINSSAE